MKYIIQRTSLWSEDKPCKEAKKMSIKNWHTRTCSEEEFNRKFSDREGLWKSKGTNHKKINKNWITRQEGYKDVWFVEIKTLEDLMKLINKYGDIIMSESGEENYNKIEIYDDYRE